MSQVLFQWFVNLPLPVYNFYWIPQCIKQVQEWSYRLDAYMDPNMTGIDCFWIPANYNDIKVCTFSMMRDWSMRDLTQLFTDTSNNGFAIITTDLLQITIQIDIVSICNHCSRWNTIISEIPWSYNCSWPNSPIPMLCTASIIHNLFISINTIKHQTNKLWTGIWICTNLF